MIRFILLLTAFAGACFAHNPTIPDTLGSQSDGVIREGNANFSALRGDPTGTSVSSNLTSGSERAIAYKSGAQGVDNDSLWRAFSHSDSANIGSFKSLFTGSYNIDSAFASWVFDTPVDSGYCNTDGVADSMCLIPRTSNAATIIALSSGVFGTPYSSTASLKLDTAQVVCFPIPVGGGRVNIKLPELVVDSLESMIGKSAASTYQFRYGIVTCHDLNHDSLGVSGNGFYSSLNGKFNEQTDNSLDPYTLVYWTDLTPPNNPAKILAKQRTRGVWRGGDTIRGRWRG